MPQKLNLKGERFGRLKVLKEAPQIGRKTRWLCRCKCKKEVTVTTAELRAGKTQSCGCLRAERITAANLHDLTDMEFGMLKVIRRADIKRKDHKATWLCHCKCGRKDVNIAGIYLTQGDATSCGCNKFNNKLQKTLKEEFTVDGVIITNLTQKVRSDSTTGHKGVYPVKLKQGGTVYTANITAKGKLIYLGRHKTKEAAIAAREAAEEKYFKPILDKHAETIVCAAPDCNVRFNPSTKGTGQEYHSSNCRYRHHKQIQRQKRIDLGLCPQCGGEMDPNKKSKHCDKCAKYYKDRYSPNKKSPRPEG
jgi:hypothetical protein